MKTGIQNPESRIQKSLTNARREMRPWTMFVLFALLAIVVLANEPQRVVQANAVETNATELYQSLLDLQNPWTVMCVAAHPDDEDGTSLIMLRRKFGVHTVSVFSTFGEGGQNDVGPELYEELEGCKHVLTLVCNRILSVDVSSERVDVHLPSKLFDLCVEFQ